MKILLMGDASNYHNCLAAGLSRLGHDVTVASNGSYWMNTRRQIDISRRDGKLGGLMLWLRLNSALWPRLKGYDIVNIAGPGFIQQRPQRIQAFFDKLKRANGHVFMTALGCDPFYVQSCMAPDSPLRYNEWRVDGAPTPFAVSMGDTETEWFRQPLIDQTRHVYENVEGVVSALYEYHLSAQRYFPSEKLSYGGIPIDLEKVAYTEPRLDGKINIILACHKGRELEKGALPMLEVCRRIAKDFPDKVNFDFVQNVPYDQFVNILKASHIVVDQLYSYTPATTALLAMAQGKVVVSGGEPSYYDFISEKELRPIINVNPSDTDALYDDLARLISDKPRLADLSLQSRQFVEKHNDTKTVSRRFLEFWEKRI